MQISTSSNLTPKLEAYKPSAHLHKLAGIFVSYQFKDPRDGYLKSKSVSVEVGIESKGKSLIVKVGSLPGLNSILIKDLPILISAQTKVVSAQVSGDLHVLATSCSENSFEVLKICVLGFKNWVESLGLGAEDLLRKQRVTLCLSPVMRVIGQPIDLSPAPGDCAVVTSAVESRNGTKEVACFWLNFENQVLSDLLRAQVGEDTSFQAQFLGSGLLVRNGGELSYRPLSGVSLQEPTLQEPTQTWQGVELLQRVSFSSLVCVLNSSNLGTPSRRFLLLSERSDSIQVNEYDVSEKLKYVHQFLECQAYFKKDCIQVAFLTVEKQGLWIKIFKIEGRRATLEKNEQILPKATDSNITKYQLGNGGIVRKKEAQLPLFE